MALRFLPLVLVLLLAGCDTGADQTPAPLVPLAIGNVWTYRAIEFSPQGAALDTVQNAWVHKVTADTTVEGETWYREDEYDGRTGSRTFGWRALREGGLWSDPREFDDAGYLKLAYPAAPGATGAGGTGERWTLVSTDTTVTVPAGTFRCHLYEYRSVYMDGYAAEYFYAPGVGQVLSVQRDTFNGVYVRTRSELTSYQTQQ